MSQSTILSFSYSCGLLPQDAAILTFNVSEADQVEDVINSHLRGASVHRHRRTPSSTSMHSDVNIPKCLVVDGKTLGFIFSKDLTKSFLKLADKCLSVLCCRTTPSQKAQVWVFDFQCQKTGTIYNRFYVVMLFLDFWV